MFQHRSTRSMAFWTIAILSFASQTVLAAFVVRLTTAGYLEGRVYHTALAASPLGICALAALLAAIATRRLPPTSGLTAFYAVSTAIFAVASILAIYILVRTLEHAHPSTEAHILSTAGVAIWAVAILTQAMFYGYLLWPQSKQHRSLPTDNLPMDRPSPVRSVKRSVSIHLASLTPTPPKFFRSAEPHSPADSGYGQSPRSSVRQSFVQALRPMTSKTRLIRQSSMSADSPSLYSPRAPSFETERNDGFESWDTSAVEEGYDSPCMHRATRLEPIPGSRPVSPAKPLDGPFDDLSPEDMPLPASPEECSASPSPSPSLSRAVSPTSEAGSLYAHPLPPLRRPSTNQSHIHPLFRPESPLPPPLASPGTVITASPMAGQIVSPEILSPRVLHSGASSRPGSRPGSLKSFRVQATSPEPLPPPPSSPLQESHSVTLG
jgi:hypothetical protein